MFIKLILAVEIFQKKLNSHKKRHCILLFFKFKQNTLLYKFRYFPKGFFPSDNFPRVFPKWQLPKCAISQAATSQVCPNCIARTSACFNLCEVATSQLGLQSVTCVGKNDLPLIPQDMRLLCGFGHLEA